MRRHRPIVVLLGLLLTSPLAAQPPVDGIDAYRVGSDLQLTWNAVPVVGYRVYDYRELECTSANLVYDGPANLATIAGAFTDPASVILYRIAAYDGVGEGPLSTPVYRYLGDFPGSILRLLSFSPGMFGGSVPRITTDEELCVELSQDAMVTQIATLAGLPRVHLCGTPIHTFDVAPPNAYVVGSDGGVWLWGYGHDDSVSDWTIDLPAGAQIMVSIPYDHAYRDLRDVASDIPEAIAVLVFDPVARDFDGVTRATTADPWTGTNHPLVDQRDQGLAIQVETATTWIPRRLCGLASFIGSTKDDGVAASDSLETGDPVTYTIVVTNRGGGAAQTVVVTDVLDDCLDLSGFDPVTTPSQVTVVPPTPAPVIAWTAASRTLELTFADMAPGEERTITVSGLLAGPDTAACCNQAIIRHAADPVGVRSDDLEETGPTCMRIGPGSCSPLPEIVGGVKAVEVGGDIRLGWVAATDVSTDSYNVWRVVDPNPVSGKRLIPVANRLESEVDPLIVATCSSPLIDPPTCDHVGGMSEPPDVVFYQVRGVCSNGIDEGTEHPY